MCLLAKLETLNTRMATCRRVRPKERRKVEAMLDALRRGDADEQEARSLLSMHRGLLN